MAHQNAQEGVTHREFLRLLQDFTQWLTRLNYAKATIRSRTRHLKTFLLWIEQKGIHQLEDITGAHLLQYSQIIHTRPLKATTIEAYLSVLKLLNIFLENYGLPPVIKTRLIVEKDIKIERTILTTAEVSRLYNACQDTLRGMRDRVILAIFYGCGLRYAEGAHLQLDDIDFKNGLVQVRMGKNYKERYVPMSQGVTKILAAWIDHGHRYFCAHPNQLLIPNTRGKITDGKTLNTQLRRLCQAAQINKRITLHSLRHSIATHLLQSGMHLEDIAQFLGHQGLEATKIYTRILHHEL